MGSGLAFRWDYSLLVCKMQEASSCPIGADFQRGQGAVEVEMRLLWNGLHDRSLKNGF